MAEQKAEEVEATVTALQKNLNKELDKTWAFCQDLEEKTQQQDETSKLLGEALVATMREQQKTKGHTCLVAFCTGEVKAKVLTKFAKFQADSKKRKEEAERAGPDAVEVETEAPVKWKETFWKLVCDWVKDELKAGRGHSELKDELQPYADQLEGLVADLAVSYVKVRVGKGKGKGKDQDDGKGEGKKGKDKDSEKALVVEVALAGGTSGAQAHELLARVFRKLYKVHREGVRKPVFSELSFKEDDGGGKDRPLCNKVCEAVGLAARSGKGKGKKGANTSSASAAAGGPAKRESPEPAGRRGSVEHSRSRPRTG